MHVFIVLVVYKFVKEILSLKALPCQELAIFKVKHFVLSLDALLPRSVLAILSLVPHTLFPVSLGHHFLITSHQKLDMPISFVENILL